jgi:AcrR family transcriptional regulator
MPVAQPPAEGAEGRPLRADARRNHERLLAAAAEAFAEHGIEVGVAEIARRAGVGAGTLFRHFPTKHDLLLAILEDRFAEVRAALATALAEDDPWAAFERVITDGAEMQVRDRCFLQSAAAELMSDPRLREIRAEILTDVATILGRAQDAGVVRDDVRPEDMPFLLNAVGGAIARMDPVRPDLWRRYLGVVLDGLRPHGATPLHPPPPTLEELDAATCLASRLHAGT